MNAESQQGLPVSSNETHLAELLESIILNCHLGLALIDQDSLVRVNRALLNIFELEIHEEHEENLSFAAFQDLLATSSILAQPQAKELQAILRALSGRKTALFSRSLPVPGRADLVISGGVLNEGVSFFCVADGQTDYQETLRDAEIARFALNNLPTPVVVKDDQLRYRMVNKAFKQYFPGMRDDVIGQTIEPYLDDPDLVAKINGVSNDVLQDGQVREVGEVIDLGDEGKLFLQNTHSRLQLHGASFVVTVLNNVTDLVNARRLAEEQNEILQETQAQAEFDSLHDPLTDLPNRRFLDRTLAEWRAATDREDLALLQIDLDRFKEINDTLGHAAGDYILCHVAQILRTSCEPSDFVARIGGDEFIVLRRGHVVRDELEHLADTLIEALNEPVAYENDLCRFGASIGIDVGIVSTLNGGRSNLSDPGRLMMNADIALYEAKRQGRGQFRFFSRDLQRQIERNKRITDDILEALERKEFFPVYQPLFDAQSMQMIGVEALARWQHPILGELGPDSFLKAAKEIGASDQIDQLVLEASLKDLAYWDEQNASIPSIAVNVSAQRLSNPYLLNLLKRLDIPAGRISFEVNEAAILDDRNDCLNDLLKEINRLGIDIAIDNFGLGQSSLLGMWKLKPQRIKIAKELVLPAFQDKSQRSFLKAMVDMNHSIGMEVVSEGVETLHHVNILRDLGIDVLQGYALGHPMKSQDLVDFARSHRKLAING